MATPFARFVPNAPVTTNAPIVTQTGTAIGGLASQQSTPSGNLVLRAEKDRSVLPYFQENTVYATGVNGGTDLFQCELTNPNHLKLFLGVSFFQVDDHGNGSVNTTANVFLTFYLSQVPVLKLPFIGQYSSNIQQLKGGLIGNPNYGLGNNFADTIPYQMRYIINNNGTYQSTNPVAALRQFRFDFDRVVFSFEGTQPNNFSPGVVSNFFTLYMLGLCIDPDDD